MDNYDRLFPPLRRRKADRDVPSDSYWRKPAMNHRLLDLCELRRSEISDIERRDAAQRFKSIPKSQRALLPPDVRG